MKDDEMISEPRLAMMLEDLRVMQRDLMAFRFHSDDPTTKRRAAESLKQFMMHSLWLQQTVCSARTVDRVFTLDEIEWSTDAARDAIEEPSAWLTWEQHLALGRRLYDASWWPVTAFRMCRAGTGAANRNGAALSLVVNWRNTTAGVPNGRAVSRDHDALFLEPAIEIGLAVESRVHETVLASAHEIRVGGRQAWLIAPIEPRRETVKGLLRHYGERAWNRLKIPEIQTLSFASTLSKYGLRREDLE